MKKTIFKAESRGEADYGWLKTHYSFSFANYYNPQCINFGALRVLNDDIIEGGKGFPMHPHDNMEIITIPLEGALAHQDSMGSSSVIKAGDIQIMSAGSGIIHSEFNHSRDKEVSLLQIWIFPRTKNIKPRYDQKSYKSEDYKEQLKCVVAPALKNGELLINQDAWLSMGEFSEKKSVKFELQNKSN
ncbi:MAG: quercetin 2,3-dioxygenase, partial [Bacteroidota bacterium]|nr:quercetin 2,3-dioxygenase [Bacteroidota bacterium]